MPASRSSSAKCGVRGQSDGLLKSSALFLGADTPLGPFYIGYGFAAAGSRCAYLFLGHP